MKSAYLFLLIPLLFYCSCRPNENQTDTNKAAKNDTSKFFQVAQYIQSQINEVNRTPYYIYKNTVIDGKTDSSAINIAVFNQLSTGFLKPDLNDIDLKKNYTESIFHDQTTKSFTISYTTNKELEIQNIEVLLQEDGKTVKRIFIRKFFNYPDSSAIEQLSWKPGQSFQIYRLVQKQNNKENSYQTSVVWNEKS